MWNSWRTDSPPSLTADATTYKAGGGDEIGTYVARPKGNGTFPSILLMHHAPGWDEIYQEFARRFANHGYVAFCPNLYHREGHGTPDDVGAKVRAAGGVPDDQVVADAEAALKWLKDQPTSNGKVGIFGTCSGGRHSVLVASRVQGFDAVADLWGGRVAPPGAQPSEKQPVPPIELTPNLNAPLLGLFGNEDQAPSPEEVDKHEAELKKNGKNYSFHRYDGAGHGFFYHDRPAYRQEQAMDGWSKVFAFFNQHLKG